MAEHSAAERTEQATPERLRKAREEGQLPESKELPSGVLIAALLASLSLCGSWLYEQMILLVREAMYLRPVWRLGSEGMLLTMGQEFLASLTMTLPFVIATAAASVAASVLSSGWSLCPKAMKVQVDRLNPAKGFQNLFSMKSVVQLVISIVKLAVIIAICWQYLSDKMPTCLALRYETAAGAVAMVGKLTMGLMLRITAAVLVVGAADLLFQRWKYQRDLRMTKQEMKEERRQHELAPEVRNRIRAVQLEMARKRMLQEVPKADVVVTNPTHVAVALQYEADVMAAPKVVAKGGDLMCQKIKEIARAHGVPVIERPELARALYGAVEVGQGVPEALYVAVAEVLAMIYRLRKRRTKR
jgi:flagellar biosynthetic protein FlhB